MQNKMTFGTCFRLCTAVVAAALLAAPSFAQEAPPDNRVFVDLSRTTGAAGSFVEATVYIDQASPDGVVLGETEGGFNALGASLMWMDGAFTWNVNAGGTPLIVSTNLMTEVLMSAPGAMPNFELLQTVDSTGTGVFFETDQTSNAITVTLVRTDFSSVEEQIIGCVHRGPLSDTNRETDNCDAFPIFRATLQVAEPPADMPPNMMDTFHDVMALATRDAQSPSPGNNFVEMDMVDNFVMVQQTGESRITVSSDTPSTLTLNTASSAAPQDVITLTVARTSSSNPDGDGLVARPSTVVWTLSGADNDSLSTLIDDSLNLTLQGVIGTATVAATATYGPIQTSADGGASSTATFSFSTAASVGEGASFTLTLRASLSESDDLFDQTDYTLAFGSFTAVGQNGMQSSAPDVSAPTVSDVNVQLRVDATQLSWTETDLGTIQAGNSIDLQLRFTDAMGNIDTNRDNIDNTALTELAIDTDVGMGTLVTLRSSLEEPNGIISFSWSHWPVTDQQAFMVSATLGSLSTSVPATGISNAVADQLNTVITVMVPDDDPTIPDTLSEEGNLVSDTINAISIAFTAADCTTARDAVLTCVPDTDVNGDVTVSAVYAWMSTQVTVVTASDGASDASSAGVTFALLVNFDNGVGTADSSFITPTLTAEDVDEALIMLEFSATVGVGGIDVEGSDTLTLVPGGPDFTIDVTGNGIPTREDLIMIFRSGFAPEIDVLDYDSLARGFGLDIAAGGLTEAEIIDRVEAFNNADIIDITGNGSPTREDLIMIFRSGFAPEIDILDYDSLARGFGLDIAAGGLTEAEIIDRIEQVNSTVAP